MALTQITEKSIKDGEIVNADINASAAIAKSKIETFVTNNADNRVITGSGTANTLNGESGLTFDGNTMNLTSGSGDARLTLIGTEGNDARLSLVCDDGDDHIDQYNIRSDATDNSLTFDQFESGSFVERMRIDSSGNVGIGTSSPGGVLDIVASANDTRALLIRNTNNSGGSAHAKIEISGGDNATAILKLECNGQNHEIFEDGNGNLRIEDNDTERMRIDSSGVVRIAHTSYTADTGADELVVGNTSSGENRGITILNHTGQDGRICFAQSGDPDAGMIKYSHGSDVLQFFVESEEMVRLNNTSVQGTPAMQLRKPNAASNVQSHMIHLIVGGHDRGALIAASSFGGSAIVGAISDYRVKTNIRNYTGGWNNIKALPVKIFDINKEGEEATDIKGWIAHEVQAVIPEAVCGTKDAKKEDGSDDYQSLGYNVFMPDVVGALQTAIAKIEVLETKVAALEAA
jgi:hypothetical protein